MPVVFSPCSGFSCSYYFSFSFFFLILASRGKRKKTRRAGEKSKVTNRLDRKDEPGELTLSVFLGSGRGGADDL